MALKLPFSFLNNEQQKSTLMWLVTVTLVTIIAMQTLSAPLVTKDAPAGIVSFELAGDLQTSNTIIDSWNEQIRIFAGLGLGLDFLFLLLYSTTLALACSIIKYSLTLRKPIFSMFGTLVIWSALIAGVCDGIENIALIKLLLGSQSQLWPMLANVFAITKFILIAMALIYIVWGSVANRLIGSRKNNNASPG